MSHVPTPKRGRPRGYTINPDAFAVISSGRSQAGIAQAAGISPSHLAEMLAGSKGATREVTEQLCVALGIDRPGCLFPELAAFRTEVRHFVASIDGDLVPV